MKKTSISGINFQDGFYLAKLLLSEGYKVPRDIILVKDMIDADLKRYKLV